MVIAIVLGSIRTGPVWAGMGSFPIPAQSKGNTSLVCRRIWTGPYWPDLSSDLNWPSRLRPRAAAATSDQRPATSDQRPATSDQRPATSDQRPATSDQRPATSDGDRQRPKLHVEGYTIDLHSDLHSVLHSVSVGFPIGFRFISFLSHFNFAFCSIFHSISQRSDLT
jgi:hypothetical protein